LERQVHGRARRISSDELFFGPMQAMLRARLATPRRGAQWTGLTTRLAERLLETGRVDAVIATASAHDDRWAPRPIVATTSHELAECRGMKMGFSPIVAMVERAIDAGHRRLAIVGVACQVHAIRALQDRFGLDVVYVIGTPCSDNTTTAHFHHFLSLLTPTPERVQYLEFMPDYEVELRFDDGTTRRIPFMQLPLRDLPADFFPDGCRTCFDYTNALSDITVGYMGGSGDQWIMVRNTRGGELLDLLRDELVVRPVESRGHRAAAVRTFVAALRRAGSGLPLRRAPRWARPIIGWMQRTFGPRGLEFARTRVEMKAAEGVLTLTRERPRRLGRAVPDFVWTLVAPYGITPPGLSGNRSRS
jgi:coenzyme F420 hydrogenase subunit beta